MKHVFLSAALLFSLFTLTSCEKDDQSSVKGVAQFEITDAPIDDANVQGAFVTVTAVKVDGQVISNFSGKKTIDLLALQNGNTSVLGTGELKAGTYNNVSLVLDYASDANGNSPGCYVLTTDNVKHDLKASSSTTGEFKINSGAFTVEEGQTSNVVIDFDLRKTIRYEDNPSSSDKYNFVSDAELNSGLRMVSKQKAGTITGQCQDNMGLAQKIIVYAYKKGTYNKQTEMSGQGSGQIQFKNCVTSATVDKQGNYKLAFLEEGDYELHFIAYEDSNGDGKLEVKGELSLSLLGGINLDLTNISVQSSAEVTASVLVTGLIP
ncbi:MAG: hypothetical protein KatS3mg029_0314 [Saprospiraceae bacterium]|nr:MAG: hypothetical protein KatS3mg029_0314 [Saprospiraceae bacterium]